ncbi:MAG TPA: formate dehydrogenase accessory protein FdhE [Phycisphaerae bacterium]|nr:formate dehydrogenase accessory protein FdhE [Phycisphaerae bacterium]
MCARDEGTLTREPDRTLAQLEALIGRDYVSTEYVRFRIDLLKGQWAVRQAFAQASSAGGKQDRTQGTDDTHRVQAALVLDEAALALDPRMLASLFEAICPAIRKDDRQSADVQTLLAAVEKKPALLGELVRNSAFAPDGEHLVLLSERVGASVEALLFFGRALAAPLLTELASRTARKPESDTSSSGPPGCCGLCGSPPGMAKLRRDDGKRILHCSLCDGAWAFSRLECPFCGNREHGTLSYLRANETDPWWVETCEKCKQYIKVVDDRRLALDEETIMLVEDVATLHLDLLAEREGYKRRMPYTALS